MVQYGGKFAYPSHWNEDATVAFKAVDGDHDSHGFSPDFIARQEDRDRYLEDFLANSSGGFTFNFVGPLANGVSDLLPFTQSTTYRGIMLTLRVASASAGNVLSVLLDGVVQATTTFPAGQNTYNWVFPSGITGAAYVDNMQLRIVTADTTSAGLVGVPYS